MVNQVDLAQTIINTFAGHLSNALLAAKVVTTRSHDNEIDADNGLTTRQRVPPRYTVDTTVGSVPVFSRQDTVVGTEIIRVNKVKTVGLGYGDFERIKSFSDAVESQALRAAAVQMANNIDGEILDTAALAFFNWVGTPGLSLDSPDEFNTAVTRLMEEGVEDNDLNGVLTFGDRQGLQSFITNLNMQNDNRQALRRASVGEISGVPTMFTQQLPTFIAGTRPVAAVLVNGAAQNVNYRDVATAAAQGEHNTQSLIVDTAGAGMTFKKGDVFTIAGVNAWDNRKQASLGRLQQFTVIADATADGLGNATIKIAPAIIVQGSGAGSDVKVNTAHATVDAAPADNALLTFLGTPGGQFKQRIVMQKQAISLNTARLVRPQSDTVRFATLQDVPITVRMWWHSNFTNASHDVRFDTAVDVNIMDRRRGVRVNGVA